MKSIQIKILLTSNTSGKVHPLQPFYIQGDSILVAEDSSYYRLSVLSRVDTTVGFHPD